MLKVLPHFESRLLILVPNIRQGKCFFCVLYRYNCVLAGWHVKKSQKLDLEIEDSALRSAFLTPKTGKFLHKPPDIFTCRPSKHHVVVQEKILGSKSLQSPSNLAQKCSSSAANCWFECVEEQKLFFYLQIIYISFMCCWTITCLR